MLKRISVLAVAAVCSAAVCVPAEAGLVGSSVMVTGYFGATSNPPPTCDPFTILCGFAQSPYNGGTTPETDVVPTATLFEYLATTTSTSISDTKITITNLVDPAQGSTLFCKTSACDEAFTGLVYSFTGNQPITNVTVDPSTPAADFQPRSLSWLGGNTIFVDLTGAQPDQFEQMLVLDVTTQGVTPPVPEPSSWALMIVGFGGLGWAGWRRRRSACAI